MKDLSVMKNRGVFFLILIMCCVTLIVAFTAIFTLYQTAIDQELLSLREYVQSQARLMEAISKFDKQYSEDYPAGSHSATISQIMDAQSRHRKFARSGELTLAMEEEGKIVFILSHMQNNISKPHSIPIGSNIAEPMNRALAGQSGAMIGLDYKEVVVLAAYEPVDELNMGLVAKVNLEEIKSPFIDAGIFVAIVALISILTASCLFFFVALRPLMKVIPPNVDTLKTKASTQLSTWKHFSHYFLPLYLTIFVSILVVILVHHVQSKEEIFNNDVNELLHISEFLGANFNSIESDLYILSKSIELERFLGARSEMSKSDMVRNFKIFLKARKVYTQIRLLDTSGKELVRADLRNGQISVVPDHLLQDKSHRYYFKAAINLAKDQVSISRMDLNIENGKIEVPYKPVVRFSTPVFDSEGNKQGVIVINYLTSAMLSEMRKEFDETGGRGFLVDNYGNWLIAANQSHEWSFMFDNQYSFSKDFPKAWQQITETNKNQFEAADDHFTVVAVEPEVAKGLLSVSLDFPYPEILVANKWYLILLRNKYSVGFLSEFEEHMIESLIVLILLVFLLAGGWHYAKLRMSFAMSEQRITKQILASLDEQEVRLRSIVNNSPALISFKNLSGEYILTNRRFDLLHEGGAKAIIGKTAFDLFPKNIADSIWQNDLSAIAKDKPVEFEETYQHLNGSEYSYLTIKFPVKLPEKGVVGICAISTDITERNRAEATLGRAEKMEAIGHLASGVAHDFNNLLGIILGNVELMEMDPDNKVKLQERMETCRHAALRGASLTRQLMTFSRHHDSEHELQNINMVIQSVDQLIARSVTPEIHVNYVLSEEPWLTVIDSGGLADALINMAVNARDAMPEGGSLTIETKNLVLDQEACSLIPGICSGEYVKLSVSDTGCGMSPEVKQKALEPFFSTKPIGKGTGLGMSTINNLAKSCNGALTLYSEIDIGTSMHLYFPRAETEVAKDQCVQTEAAELPVGSETILIVDDEPQLAHIASEQLQSLGYTTFIAGSSKAAFKMLDEIDGVDLLFCDVILPGGKNGYDIVTQAKQYYPSIKILLTSGFTSRAALQEDQQYLLESILEKPYTKAELAGEVNRILN